MLRELKERERPGKGGHGARLSVIVCPGCGKPYDVRVNTINAEMFCDRCRLSTVVVIRPGRYVAKQGEENAVMGGSGMGEL